MVQKKDVAIRTHDSPQERAVLALHGLPTVFAIENGKECGWHG